MNGLTASPAASRTVAPMPIATRTTATRGVGARRRRTGAGVRAPPGWLQARTPPCPTAPSLALRRRSGPRGSCGRRPPSSVRLADVIDRSGTAATLPRQRWRLVFARDDGARDLTHRDSVRLWERALVRRGRAARWWRRSASAPPGIRLAAPARNARGARARGHLLLAERADVARAASSPRMRSARRPSAGRPSRRVARGAGGRDAGRGRGLSDRSCTERRGPSLPGDAPCS